MRCAAVRVREGGVSETLFGKPHSMATQISKAVEWLARRGFDSFSTKFIGHDGDYRIHLVTGMKTK